MPGIPGIQNYLNAQRAKKAQEDAMIMQMILAHQAQKGQKKQQGGGGKAAGGALVGGGGLYGAHKAGLFGKLFGGEEAAATGATSAAPALPGIAATGGAAQAGMSLPELESVATGGNGMMSVGTAAPATQSMMGAETMAGISPLLGIAGVAATPIVGKMIAKQLFKHDRTPRPMIMDEVLQDRPNTFRGTGSLASLIGGDRAHQEEIAKKGHDLGFITNTGYGDKADPTKSKNSKDPWQLNLIAPRSVRPVDIFANGGNWSAREKEFNNKSFEDQLGEMTKDPLGYKPDYLAKAKEMLAAIKGSGASPMPEKAATPMPRTVPEIAAMQGKGRTRSPGFDSNGRRINYGRR